MPEPLASALFRAPEVPGIYNVLFIGPKRGKLYFKIGKAHNIRRRLKEYRYCNFIVLRVWPTGPRPYHVDTARLATLETQALKIIRAYATDGGVNPCPELFEVPCVKKALQRLDAWAREAGLKNEGPRLIWKPKPVNSIAQVDGRLGDIGFHRLGEPDQPTR